MDEVDEGVGEVGVLRRLRDDHLVAGDGNAFLRQGIGDVVVLVDSLAEVAVVAVDEDEVPGGDAVPVEFAVELRDVLDPLYNEVGCCRDLRLVRGVETVAKGLKGCADCLAHVVEERAGMGVFGVAEHLPCRLEVGAALGVVGDSGV